MWLPQVRQSHNRNRTTACTHVVQTNRTARVAYSYSVCYSNQTFTDPIVYVEELNPQFTVLRFKPRSSEDTDRGGTGVEPPAIATTHTTAGWKYQFIVKNTCIHSSMGGALRDGCAKSSRPLFPLFPSTTVFTFLFLFLPASRTQLRYKVNEQALLAPPPIQHVPSFSLRNTSSRSSRPGCLILLFFSKPWN